MEKEGNLSPFNSMKIKDKELRRWQESYSAMAGVFLCCLGPGGEKIIDFAGNPLDVAEIKKAVPDVHIMNFSRGLQKATWKIRLLREPLFRISGWEQLRSRSKDLSPLSG